MLPATARPARGISAAVAPGDGADSHSYTQVVEVRDYVQLTRNKCGSCESQIAVEFGVTVGTYYAGPVTAANYESCPICDHAFTVA